MKKLNEDILSHMVEFLDNKKCICHNCEFNNLILCSKYYLKTLKQFVHYTKPFTSEKYKSLLYEYNKMYLCPKHFANFTQKEIMAFEKIHDKFKHPTTKYTFMHMETVQEMSAFIKKLDMVCNMFIFTYYDDGRGSCCSGTGQKFIKRGYEENHQNWRMFN